MTAPHPIVPGLTGLALLARGGYATVYRAVQESVGREVAVKVENRSLESERDRRRFLREARASGSMSSHPHVVDLFDAGVCVGGHPYLIMELCQGSYADRIRIAPLSAGQTRDLGVKIADALADAHSLGVLHRDVKPANILISRFGEPALADFGLAILSETRDMSITLDVLTPAYAPPEMFRHEAPAPSGDVYSLCATLYAMVRGRPPRWRDGAPNPSIVSMVDMFDDPIPDVAGVPRDLMGLLRCGLSNDQLARPTAAELRDALAGRSLDGRALLGSPFEIPSADAASEQPTAALGQPIADAGHPTPGGGHPAPASEHPAPSGEHPAPTGEEPTEPVARPAETGRRQQPPAPPLSSRSPRWRRWALIAGVVVADVLVVVLAITVFTTAEGGGSGRPIGRASSVRQSPRPSPDPRSSVSGTQGSEVGGVCPAGVPGTMRCPVTPECYGEVLVSGGIARSKRLDCAARHTWEVFAFGQLPAEMTTVEHRVVVGNSMIRQSCDIATLALIGGFDVIGWQTEVLPPSPEQFRAGQRTYRCLAGPGSDRLVGPQLRAVLTRR